MKPSFSINSNYLFKRFFGKNFEAGIELCLQIIKDSLQLSFQPEFALMIVSPWKMKRLNRQFLNRKGVTDVISICYNENEAGFSPAIGEIFLCPKHIFKQAKQFGCTPWFLLTRNLIHGLLHLFEFDHEQSLAFESVTMFFQDEIHETVLKLW